MSASASAELDEVIAAVLGVDPATLREREGRAAHGAWSSRKQLEIAVAVERRFGVEFTSEEIFGSRTVSALRDLLRARGVIS